MINDISLPEILKEAIEKENYTFSETWDILLKYKNNGGAKVNAEYILNKLWKEYEGKEIFEDRVLDLLDITAEFCNSNLKIWH